MKLTETPLEGLFILEPKVLEDNRGFFMESYNKKKLEDLGISAEFVQDNHSKSIKGVIRGLHFQNPPYEQTKLIRAVAGELLDVVVDIRKQSPTYGQKFAILLSAKNKKQLYVPPGFAHGIEALEDGTEILYKCDQYYNSESEGGLLYSDPDLAIDWKVDLESAVVSDKDKIHPTLSGFESQF